MGVTCHRGFGARGPVPDGPFEPTPDYANVPIRGGEGTSSAWAVRLGPDNMLSWSTHHEPARGRNRLDQILVALPATAKMPG